MAAPTIENFEMTAALADLTNWLVRQGLEDAPVDIWLENFCTRMVAAGIPAQRVNLSLRAHHPEIGAVAFRWHRDSGSERFDYQRSNETPDDYLKSPLYYLITQPVSEIRHKLNDPELEHDFPVYEEFRAQGSTEYYAAKRHFLSNEHDVAANPADVAEGMTISMTTDAEGGFSDAQMDGFRALLAPLCLTLKCGANRLMAHDITAAYLGRDAAERVLSGKIRRGTSETMSAVIWYFDLENFTKLSEAYPGETIIALLNDYFAEAVDIVESAGGNVLKFMGDGMLAIFDLQALPDARRIAVEAAVKLRKTVVQMNQDRAKAGLPTTTFTLGLHAGDVLYGNIGGKTRLDFTVIGTAVNQTARILGMCDPLDQSIVISSAVATPLLDSRSDLVSLGQYRLRGVTDRQELFTLD